jgi:hypothetical protein
MATQMATPTVGSAGATRVEGTKRIGHYRHAHGDGDLVMQETEQRTTDALSALAVVPSKLRG